MTSAMKKGICWALATLQVTPDDIGCETALAEEQAKKPIDLPLGNKHNPNHHHHNNPLQQKQAVKNETNSSSSGATSTSMTSTSHNKGSLIKDAVHSVVDTLFGGSEDRENVQPRYSRHDVADHCTMDSCWIVINNRVYDVTRFLRMHPGGEDIILEYGGHDATTAFIDKGHSGDAFDMLADYCIGEVNEEDRFPETNHT